MSEEAATISIDGKQYVARSGENLIDVIRANGIEIPAPCYRPVQKREGRCQLCLVEIEGKERLQAACTQEVVDGMCVCTDSPRIQRERRDKLKALFDAHYEDADCENCIWEGECELMELTREYGLLPAR